MLIYVAGKFEDTEEVLRIFRQLELMGHEIVYDWTKHQNIRPYRDNPEMAAIYSKHEKTAIAGCDVFIALLTKEGTTFNREIGFAEGLYSLRGKPLVYLVGPLNKESPWTLTWV